MHSFLLLRYIGLFIVIVLSPISSNANNRMIGRESVKKVYISVKGIYRVTNNETTSIYISKNDFEGFKYITVKANKEHGTRVHFLKQEPKNNNERVQYSDYYKESVLVRKGMKIDIVIPCDAKSIYILKNADHNYNPDIINLYTPDSLYNNSDVNEIRGYSRPNKNGESLKIMHWNIGNFSQGKYPYSSITEANYKIKLDGFNNFINTYCVDCHYLLNEYNETFAKVDGQSVNTASVLFDKRTDYKVFPRTTSSGYNKLAFFWKKGMLGYQYGILESLKGVKNANGTIEYGVGYCLSQYAIGEDTVFVMSLHAPNKIRNEEYDVLYKEIIEICSGYDNCVIVGDLNRKAPDMFTVLTDAGFKILNDKSVTFPPTSCLDWVLYRCKSVILHDFKVYDEAVDSNGDLLSDHLPLSFVVSNLKEY